MKVLFIYNYFNYHYEVIESVIIKYREILNINSNLQIYLYCYDDYIFTNYIKNKYSHIILKKPVKYDYYINCTVYDKDYNNIIKNNPNHIYIAHEITDKLKNLNNIIYVTPLSDKKYINLDILPYCNIKKRINIPIYIIQGKLNQGRRNLNLLKAILNKKYNFEYKIKLVGEGYLPNELNEYKDKIILRNNLNYLDYHKEFIDAYCIIPLISKDTHKAYYTNKLTSSISYTKAYKTKCLIDKDLQNIYNLDDCEVYNNEKDISEVFERSLFNFYNKLNICIIYYIPDSSLKYYDYYDGFVKSIQYLKKNFNVDMINSYSNDIIDFRLYDFVFFKESFRGKIYLKYKEYLLPNNKLGLFISSSNIIPTDNDLKLYDLLFYETKWYYDYANLVRHKNSYHAFGVDTNIMKSKNCDKKYDALFVGNICNYKRPLNILNKNGNKICIGFKTDTNLVNILEKNNVEILDFISYKNLSNYYNQSKLCYIPCQLHGGGERAVLEARACNIKIEIENDNPKLKELLKSPIYDSTYYYKQILHGIVNLQIQNIIYNFDLNKQSYSDILKLLNNININILQVGGMDGKTFDPLYNFVSNNWKLYILEPIVYQFNKLKHNYHNYNNVVLINKALDYNNDNKLIYTIDEVALQLKAVPEWANGISSFYNTKNALSEEYWNTRGLVHKSKGLTFNSIKEYIKQINIECITINEFKNNYKIDNIHLIQIDTEGYDYNILKIVLSLYNPLIIYFEWNNLDKIELEETKKLLIDYNIIFYNQDAFCLRK